MSEGAIFDLSGKSALVTGGTRGIGRAIAVALAEHGARVTITGTSEGDGEVDGFPYHRLDLCDGATIEAAAAAVDGLDILINNAGALERDGREYDPEVFDRIIYTNLNGTYRVCHAFYDHLRASRGCVVNLASMRSFIGSPDTPAYGAAKAAIVQLTRTLAVRWGAEGIRVNAIAPGPIRTDMNITVQQDPVVTKKLEERTALGRWGLAHEVAGAAVYLASPAAAFTTGSCIQTDGGILA